MQYTERFRYKMTNEGNVILLLLYLGPAALFQPDLRILKVQFAQTSFWVLKAAGCFSGTTVAVSYHNHKI